jgi:hypothetical protein
MVVCRADSKSRPFIYKNTVLVGNDTSTPSLSPDGGATATFLLVDILYALQIKQLFPNNDFEPSMTYNSYKLYHPTANICRFTTDASIYADGECQANRRFAQRLGAELEADPSYSTTGNAARVQDRSRLRRDK